MAELEFHAHKNAKLVSDY